MIAHLRKVRISPKKANLVAGMVRGMQVDKALNTLKFTPKKAAALLYKVIESASANAENNFKQNPETLIVKEIIVNEGTTYKRFQPVSRGRAHPILKRTSHITVKVEADPTLAAKAAPKAPAKKEEAKAEAPAKEETPKEESK
jgi:large subunit ribosomal protein L22